ncbi:MAG: DUF1192 family protein [bacterium]
MDEILKSEVADPRGEKILDQLTKQDLSSLSAADLTQRLKILQSEIARGEEALQKRAGATAAAEALFKN